MMSKTLMTLTKSQTVTTEMGRLNIGNIMRRKMFHSPAPSTRAASMISAGIPLIAAGRTTMTKPGDAQTDAEMRAEVKRVGRPSQAIGWKPGAKAWVIAVNTAMSGVGV